MNPEFEWDLTKVGTGFSQSPKKTTSRMQTYLQGSSMLKDNLKKEKEDSVIFKCLPRSYGKLEPGQSEMYLEEEHIVNSQDLPQPMSTYGKNSQELESHSNLDSKFSIEMQPLTGIEYGILPKKGRLPIRGEELPDYEEPPNPRHFANIDRVNNLVINPGDIKQFNISHDYKGSHQLLFERIKAKFRAGYIVVADVVAGCPGKSQMIALEEMIRSISSNDINITYERQIEIGCFLSSMKKKVEFTTSVKSQAFNNLGP